MGKIFSHGTGEIEKKSTLVKIVSYALPLVILIFGPDLAAFNQTTLD